MFCLFPLQVLEKSHLEILDFGVSSELPILECFFTWCFKHARIPVGTHSQNNIYCFCCIILFLLMINLSPVNDVNDWLKPHKFQPILKYVTMVDPITGWFKIMHYKNKKVTTTKNLVETMFLTRYHWII